jgi:hypothetical protein
MAESKIYMIILCSSKRFIRKQYDVDGEILFPLTAYMKNDPEFMNFKIYMMNLETKTSFAKNAGHKELMENYPDGIASIQIRERIVLPLLTIQQ